MTDYQDDNGGLAAEAHAEEHSKDDIRHAHAETGDQS